jgi:hypothetical protein
MNILNINLARNLTRPSYPPVEAARPRRGLRNLILQLVVI